MADMNGGNYHITEGYRLPFLMRSMGNLMNEMNVIKPSDLKLIPLWFWKNSSTQQ